MKTHSKFRPMKNHDYREFLKEKFEERCKANSRYSLRAFARDLELSSSRLSEVLKGKYGLSGEAAEKIAKKLNLNSKEAEVFCHSVNTLHARSSLQKTLAKKRLEQLRIETHESSQITLDTFKVISDWYHYAILELVSLQTFENSARWIANQLDLPITVVEMALERLERLGFLEIVEGKWQASSHFSFTPTDIPSDAIKKFHRQILEKALSALVIQSVEERDFSTLVMAVDKNKVPEAKSIIKKFRKEFDAEITTGMNKDSIYCLSIQFFSLTKKI